MGKIALNEHEYQDYLTRGNWKCHASPIGGHNWVSGQNSQTFTCKYCGEIKDMPIPIPENQFLLRKSKGFKRRGAR